jgi:hypothetical protein
MNLQGVFPPIMPHFSYVFIAWLQLVDLIGFTGIASAACGGECPFQATPPAIFRTRKSLNTTIRSAFLTSSG